MVHEQLLLLAEHAAKKIQNAVYHGLQPVPHPNGKLHGHLPNRFSTAVHAGFAIASALIIVAVIIVVVAVVFALHGSARVHGGFGALEHVFELRNDNLSRAVIHALLARG